MQILYVTVWLLVTRVCFIYLQDEFFFLFLVLLNEMSTLGESKVFFLFLVLIRWNEEGRWVLDFLLPPRVFESYPSDLPRSRSRNLVCVVCFCSIGDWSLKLVWEMRVGFENTCTATGKWNVSRVIPRLYGWVYKIWRLFPLAAENSVAVMTASSQSRRSQIVSYGRLWLRVPN